MATRTLGTCSWAGLIVRRTLFTSPPLDSLPSSAYSVTSLLYSPVLENHPIFHPSTTGSERVWDTAHHQLQREVCRRKMTADLRRSEAPNYQPGQKVWLSTRDIRMLLPCRKFQIRWPFTITKQINPVTYQIQLPPQYRIHPSFHVSLLKPYHSPGSPSTEPGPTEELPLPLILEDGAIYKVN